MVVRVEKRNDYSVISNLYLRKKDLSMKAKGLLTTMLSLPDDWGYSVNGLAAFTGMGVSAVRSTLLELEKHGYLERRRERKENGTFGAYEYIVHETPVSEQDVCEKPHEENPQVDNPHADEPQVDEPHAENRTLQNTNIQNTKLQNTDYTKESSAQNAKPSTETVKFKLFGPFQNVRLTEEDYIALQEDFPLDYDDRIENLSNYLENNPKKHYANHLLTIRLWAKKDGDKPAPAKKKEYDNKEADAFFDTLEV